MSKLQVIVGGQYGSEGKGAIAGYLAAQETDLLAVRVAGPNAGHTAIGRCPPSCTLSVGPMATDTIGDIEGQHKRDAHPWRLRQVPVAAVTNPDARLLIAQGSEIEPEVLLDEISALDSAGYKASFRLEVDSSATLIQPHHHVAEKDLSARIGSTGKGVGAARASRVRRDAALAGGSLALRDLNFVATAGEIRKALRQDCPVQIEGTQGFLLGQHAGYYPFCTSSDCTAVDFLAMAGVQPWQASELEIWVVFRSFPIRVGGNSGFLPFETTWGAIGQPPELTTVTKKVRRVAHWNGSLARSAILANGGPGMPVMAAVTMADYELPWLAGMSRLDQEAEPSHLDQLDQLLAKYTKDLGTPPRLLGTGPATLLDMRSLLVPRKKPYQVIP